MKRFSKEQLCWLYSKMQEIRQFEEKAKELFALGEIPGFIHLYAGEEAIAVGVCANLKETDFITSTHRAHGHCIAKGMDIKKLFAELYGKSTGVCKGKGGSMHVADLSKGILGANPIVGGGIPHACGSALTAKIKKTNQVTVSFFGDGATNQGTFHESLNLASIWNLPVVFVIENNLYAQSTPQEYHQKIKDIYLRASSYNIPGDVADGMDVFSVYEKAEIAIDRARKGEGPTLLEFKTYRYYGHFEGDGMTYRTKDEMDKYRKEKDCITQFRRKVIENKLLTEEGMNKIDKEVKQLIQDAVEFAHKSPYPDLDEILTDVYVAY